MTYKKRFIAKNTNGQMSPISGFNSNAGNWNNGYVDDNSQQLEIRISAIRTI